jgi:ribose-phosphate pyrophosphokinase
MELLVMVDALKRASAGRVTAAIPYMGYARQDRRPNSARVPITAKVVANMMSSVGVDRVLTMDLHSEQIQGFFDIPVDNIYSGPIMLGDVWKQNFSELVVVSPDVGGVVRARALAKRLEADLAIIDKRRPKPNVATVMNIIGEVQGKNVVIVDDLIDTGSTFVQCAEALKRQGAEQIIGVITHPVFSGSAVQKIGASEALTKLYVTDTIPLRERNEKIETLSVSGLFAEAINRTHDNLSISSLFEKNQG